MSLPVQSDMITITALSAIVCAIVSPFLLFGRNSYISSLSGKTSILGFAAGALFFQNLSSPVIVMLGFLTALAGALVVKYCENKINISKLNLSLIVSALFLSAGLFIFNGVAHSGSIGINSLIFGEIALAPLHRVSAMYVDLGTMGIYVLVSAIIIVTLCIFLFYKELKLAIFDEGYASALRSKINYQSVLLPAIVSFTICACVQSAGAFMTSALLILPGATAYFYTKRLSSAITISVLVATASALTGYGMAYDFKSSSGGAVVCVMSALFLASLLIAPETGIIYRVAQKRSEKEALKEKILLTDLLNVSMKDCISDYHNVNVIEARLHFKREQINVLINKLKILELVHIENDTLFLTETGKERALSELIKI